MAEKMSGGGGELAMVGEEFENYCRKHGLCNLCAQTKTHKREFKLVKKNQWKPLTVETKDGSGYVVYKGYCVQPGCFTLDQAKRLLGEVGGDSDSASGDGSVMSDSTEAKTRKKLGSRLLQRKSKKKKKGSTNNFDGLTGFSSKSSKSKKN